MTAYKVPMMLKNTAMIMVIPANQIQPIRPVGRRLSSRAGNGRPPPHSHPAKAQQAEGIVTGAGLLRTGLKPGSRDDHSPDMCFLEAFLALIEGGCGHHGPMADLPFRDRTDFDNAERGFVARLSPAVVKAADGRVVWDNDSYDFLNGECPEDAHPSLWRQGQLCAKQGLFEVTDGIYQVRGLDLSNMTIVEGEAGVIVIDPLISTECAAAALRLYRDNRGERPVTGVIYTHSHADHFGGRARHHRR